ncbi:MAG: hypothetical protein P1S46_06190 [bacterium]|nr:hypothetical protein [bacterium]
MSRGEYDQDKLVTAIEILTQRKKDVNETLSNHAYGRCSCSKVRTHDCRNTQKRLRAKVRGHREAIKDLEGLVR